jgi:hypothetical protein
MNTSGISDAWRSCPVVELCCRVRRLRPETDVESWSPKLAGSPLFSLACKFFHCFGSDCTSLFLHVDTVLKIQTDDGSHRFVMISKTNEGVKLKEWTQKDENGMTEYVSVKKTMTLRDVIEFSRNKQTYNIQTSNCIHFAFDLRNHCGLIEGGDAPDKQFRLFWDFLRKHLSKEQVSKETRKRKRDDSGTRP